MTRKAHPRLGAAQRRALIEVVAARLFAERGYTSTRLDDIAAEAGVTKPILYRHFASKKALYLAILDRHREEQLRWARAAMGEELLTPQLRRLLDAWFASVLEHPDQWRMIFRDSTGDTEIRSARARAQDNARALIVAALREQPDLILGRLELEPAAELLRSAMAGLALWSLDHPQHPRQVLVDLVVRAFLGVVGPSSSYANRSPSTKDTGHARRRPDG